MASPHEKSHVSEVILCDVSGCCSGAGHFKGVEGIGEHSEIRNYGLGISLMGRHTSTDSFPGIQGFLHGAAHCIRRFSHAELLRGLYYY